MKGRSLLLDRLAGRPAAALLVDGRLEDLLVDPDPDTPLPGAIFRALPDRPVKGMGGVFVRLPGGDRGYLRQLGGIVPGRPLLVQVSGPAEPGKALPVTTRLLLKGRLLILTPGAPGLNLSRAIRDEALRADLAARAEAGMAGADPGLGVIVRSSAAAADPAALAAELAELRRLAEAILAEVEGPAALLLDGAGAQDVALRDWDGPGTLLDDAPGSLDRAGALEQIRALAGPGVALPGGASMTVEPTRALVAVDVNTGTDTSPAAALKANIAAARDLPRQLRLRGLGGQVVIDFAPMPKRDRAVLDQALRAAFRHEGAETFPQGFTAMGLYELQRRRDRWPLPTLFSGA